MALPSFLDDFFSIDIRSSGTRIAKGAGINVDSATLTATLNVNTGLVDLTVAAGALPSQYLKPTGSGGTAGLSIGRYDLDATGGAIPGVWGVRNDDGTGFALKVDNGASLTSSAWPLQVGGTGGASLLSIGLDLPVQGSAPAAPSSGFLRPYATALALAYKASDGVVRKIEATRARLVTHADTPVTALDGDVIFADTSGGGVAIIVPVAVGAGVEIYKTSGDVTAITVTCAGNIGGGASVSIAGAYATAFMRGDGTNVFGFQASF